MENYEHGLLFDPALSAEIKERFCYVDADPEFGKRLFFENSGGSLRLKASVEEQAKYQAFPDCPERVHARSKELKRIQLRGIDDVMHVVFGASGGALLTETVFSWPGMGTMINTAINNRDYSLIQGTVLFSAIMFVFCNMLVDIAYAILNPKVKLEKG